VTACVIILAYAAGRGVAGTVLTGLAILAGQFSVGWSNDYLDRQLDQAAGRADKPVALGLVRPRLVAAAACGAFACCVPLSLASGWRAGIAHLAGVCSAWAYNLSLKRSAWSPLPYMVAFGLLPAFVSLGLPGHPWPAWWAVTAGALLGAGIHFADVLPDIDEDLATGVRGLPQRLGGAASRLTAGAMFAGAAAVLAIAGGSFDGVTVAGLGISAAAAAAGVAAAARPARGIVRSHTMHAIVAAGFLDVALLVARGARLH